MPPRDQSSFFDPLAMREQRNDDVLNCFKCGCQWLEVVEVFQFPEMHTVILGQKPPAKKGPFYIYRCPKCQEVFEPTVLVGARDSTRAGYDAFVKHMKKDISGPAGENV